jgi:hypothetical protein
MRFAALAAAILAVSCGTTERAGVYAGAQPTAAGDDRYVRIYLKLESRASAQASSRERQFFAEGSWRQLGDGSVEVELTGEQPQRMVFRASGDQLVAKEWDRAFWGPAGPGVLRRVR